MRPLAGIYLMLAVGGFGAAVARVARLMAALELDRRRSSFFERGITAEVTSCTRRSPKLRWAARRREAARRRGTAQRHLAMLDSRREAGPLLTWGGLATLRTGVAARCVGSVA